MIPEGWSVERGDVVSTKITKGASPKWQGFDYQDDGVLFVTSENVRDGFLDVSSPKYLPIAFWEKQKGSQLRYGDVLINIVGASIGRSCRFDLSGAEANINQAVCVLRPMSFELGSYLIQYLQSPRGIQQLLGQQSDSARPNLSLEDIRSFPFPLPPSKERAKIVHFLETWDLAIETVEKLIANARAQKQALMLQLLPQGTTPPKKRLPGFSGEWREIRIGDVVKEVSRPVDWDDKTTYKLISVRRRSEGIFHRESLLGHEILTKAMKVAHAGDFLISKMQIVHGASALVKPDFDGFNISGSYIALVPNDQAKLDIEFFDWYSRTRYFYKLTYISSYGVHIEKMTFNLKSFLKQTILIPESKAEQSAIVEQLNSAEALIGVCQLQAAALRQEKAALMQQLLTGKRRVKLPESEVA